MSSKVESLLSDAEAAMGTADYQKALAIAKTLTAIAPRNPDGHMIQAEAHKGLGDAAAAFISCTKALEVTDPDDAIGMRNALVLRALVRPDTEMRRSIEDLEAAVERERTPPP